MKDVAIVALCKIPAIACFLAAGYIASIGMDGWGWFLVVGCLVTVSVKVD